jgi:hypothetical protein
MAWLKRSTPLTGHQELLPTLLTADNVILETIIQL